MPMHTKYEHTLGIKVVSFSLLTSAGVFRKLLSDFITYGNHSTIYHVELPPWLPDNILTQMLQKYKALVVKQLRLMMNSLASLQKKNTHKHLLLRAKMC
jgi:hypothetical protein